MTNFLDNGDKTLVQGDFNLQTELKVFIDLGHDTIKAARIYDNDFFSMMNHFEIPTVILPELVKIQQDLVKNHASIHLRNVNSSFKFFKQNVD